MTHTQCVEAPLKSTNLKQFSPCTAEAGWLMIWQHDFPHAWPHQNAAFWGTSFGTAAGQKHGGDRVPMGIRIETSVNHDATTELRAAGLSRRQLWSQSQRKDRAMHAPCSCYTLFHEIPVARHLHTDATTSLFQTLQYKAWASSA